MTKDEELPDTNCDLVVLARNRFRAEPLQLYQDLAIGTSYNSLHCSHPSTFTQIQRKILLDPELYPGYHGQPHTYSIILLRGFWKV